MFSSALDAARRAYLNLVRGAIMSVDDSGPIQVLSVRLMPGELPTKIERPQHYGFSSVPRGPDANGANAAELVVGFIHGNRSHPIGLTVDDRRTRPRNWKEGDSGLWHDKGASCKHTDTGWVFDAGDQKQPHETKVGKSTVKQEDEKITLDVNGTTVVVKDGKIYLGADPDKSGSGSFYPVKTTGGDSSIVLAKV